MLIQTVDRNKYYSMFDIYQNQAIFVRHIASSGRKVAITASSVKETLLLFVIVAAAAGDDIVVYNPLGNRSPQRMVLCLRTCNTWKGTHTLLKHALVKLMAYGSDSTPHGSSERFLGWPLTITWTGLIKRNLSIVWVLFIALFNEKSTSVLRLERGCIAVLWTG